MAGELLGVGVRDLRSFGAEKQLVPVRSINVLVGKNSCGKSTFLRTYPLLRQSIEGDTRTPILWYAGYGGYVDFGDFKTSVRDGEDQLFFDFSMLLKVESRRYTALTRELYEARVDAGALRFSDTHRIQYEKYNDLVRPRRYDSYEVDLELGLSMVDKDKLLSTLILSVFGVTVELNYSDRGVNRFEVRTADGGYSKTFDVRYISSKGNIIPTEVSGIKDVTLASGAVKMIDSEYLGRHVISNVIELLGLSSSKHAELRKRLGYLDSRPKDELKRDLIKIISDMNYVGPLKKIEKEGVLEAIQANILALNVSRFWSAADDLLKNFYSGVRYMGPLRATAERFYRFQDLQIGELDHTGANLPMLIYSLDRAKRKELSDWIKANFGFLLELQVVGSHYTLRIKEEGESNYHNISDMGFGYSQILPVIVSVWLELVNKNGRAARGVNNGSSRKRALVIEQPELHLHPALQYKFGLAIANVAALGKQLGYTFVIETHSKHMIDALCEAVRCKSISSEDLSICLFEKEGAGQTKIRFSGFDDNGYLTNWPAGFLAPDYDYNN
ncbi:AAA family ATPase [Pseudomonas sp. GD03944]|uniref:AAA family ATPase n=1 Tax=Pseudomonas sp. GD03944 TaxID=2975409 RepID=UPI002446EE10|nr:AAA family ATPase [Pseudomonas sp. GD03944]MDH1263557.1 AAA family ATPase [Pseudomonas sp. GD03944]